MTKPRILLSGSNGDRSNYEHAITAVGGEPVSAYCPDVDLTCDGLVLCGGGDIAPERFNRPNQGSVEIDPARDEAEFALARAFLRAGKPILGICRGHQMLNVVLGGTLVQDMGPELNLLHRRGPEDMDKVHPVRSRPGSFFHTVYGPVFSVNSSHHQALGELGEGLQPVLWSESGVVEGMVHTSLPVFSVQFHPERMSFRCLRPDTVDGGAIFRHFMDLCLEKCNAR